MENNTLDGESEAPVSEDVILYDRRPFTWRSEALDTSLKPVCVATNYSFVQTEEPEITVFLPLTIHVLNGRPYARDVRMTIENSSLPIKGLSFFLKNIIHASLSSNLRK